MESVNESSVLCRLITVLSRIKWLGIALLSVSVLPAAGGATAAPNAIAEPATWMPHNLIVHLNHLPKRYSCNDLWYRFHDILLEIGARSDLKILPYKCESALGEGARSPRVQLQFQLPEVLSGKQARWADVRVIKSTVVLGAGNPKSLDAADCELLQQIKDTLLAQLSAPVVSYHLACHAPSPRKPDYSVAVVVEKAANQGQLRDVRWIQGMRTVGWTQETLARLPATR